MYIQELFLLISVFPISLSFIILALFLDEMQFENSLLNKKAEPVVVYDDNPYRPRDVHIQKQERYIDLHDYIWDVQSFFPTTTTTTTLNHQQD